MLLTLCAPDTLLDTSLLAVTRTIVDATLQIIYPHINIPLPLPVTPLSTQNTFDIVPDTIPDIIYPSWIIVNPSITAPACLCPDN